MPEEEISSSNEQRVELLRQQMNLITSDPTFRDAFDKRSEDGLINIAHAPDIINDWTIDLEFDCEDAKRYFDLDMSPMPQEELTEQIDFDFFIRAFGAWLVENNQVTMSLEMQQNPYWFKEEAPTKIKSRVPTPSRTLPQLLDEIFIKNEQETRKMFDEFAALNTQEGTIMHSDFALLLRNLLQKRNAALVLQGGVDYFSKNSVTEFLPSKQSQQADIQSPNQNEDEDWTQQPSDNQDDQQEAEISPPTMDGLTFDDFKLATTKFIGSHPNEIQFNTPVNAVKKLQENKSLEEGLLEQIKLYQNNLQTVKSELERQVIRNMITTLVKQLDLLREAHDRSMMISQRNRNSISFTNIPRPLKQALSEDDLNHQRLEKNYLELFTFFCRQHYSSRYSSFDHYSNEGQTMNLGLFMYFCSCFNLLQPHVRVPFEANQLERKRRGIGTPPTPPLPPPKAKAKRVNSDGEEIEEEEEKEEPIPDHKDYDSEEEERRNKEKYANMKPIQQLTPNELIKLPEKLRAQYQGVPSKFQWWEDEQKFDQYYHPSNEPTFANKPLDYKYLSRQEIISLVKKTTQGREFTINEFKMLLGLIAQKMFFNPENPKERHPNAYMRMLDHLSLYNSQEYKKMMVPYKLPFNCRDHNKLEGKEHKLRVITDKERLEVKAFRMHQQQVINDKANDQRSQHNNSVLSVGSMGNLNMSKIVNYNKPRKEPAKLDFDRQRISWEKLEQISFNELQSIDTRQFRPKDLIDVAEDDEDRYFLKEFEIEQDIKPHYSAEEQKRSLENYGQIKQSLRPTQKYQQQVKGNSLDQLALGRYANPTKQYQSPQVNKHQYNLKKEYLQRAQQIQYQQEAREQQILLQHLQQQQKAQVRRPYKAH